MKILPIQTLGIIAVSKSHQIHSFKLKNYVLISKFSSIYQYEIENLKLVKKSPFLHNKNFVSTILMIKNRTFATLNGTLHVLDFSTPLTRIKVFKYPITNLIKFTNKIFLFSQMEQKGLILNTWTLGTINIIRPKSKILFLSKSNISFNKNLILFYSIEGKVEVWNIDVAKKICSLNFGLFLNQDDFVLANNENSIFINFQKKNLFICDLKKKKIWNYHGEKIDKIDKIIFTEYELETFFIKGNGILYKINKKKKIIFKSSIKGHHGKINFIEFIKNNLLLTIGLYDNTIAIHYLNKMKMKFILVKKKSGKKCPPQQIHSLLVEKSILRIENQLKELQNYKNNNYKLGRRKRNSYNKKYFEELKIKSETFKKCSKVTLKQVVVKKDSFDPFEFKIGFFFYRNPKVWFLKVFQNSNFTKFANPIQCEKNLYSISCISLSSKLDIGIIGYEDNFISFFDINNRIYLFHGKNHNFFDLKFRCKISLSIIDPLEIFFLSYCSHGILNLWSLITLKIEKTLILKGLDLLSWSSIRDLILVSALDSKIYLIVPQKFCTVRVLSGHLGKIKGLMLVKNDRYLLSSSFDKTLRIWDLVLNKCSDKINFKYYPMNIKITKGENNIFISHENTIGLGEWELFYKKTSLIKKSTMKENLQKLFKKETTFALIGNLNNYSISKNKKKIIEKTSKKIWPALTYSSKFSCFNSLILPFYKFYIKNLKKIILLKLEFLELKKNIFWGFFPQEKLIFSKELTMLFFLIYEETVENILLQDSLNNIFFLFSPIILKLFLSNYKKKIYNSIYNKILIDFINMY